jgi:hypothetical protein
MSGFDYYPQAWAIYIVLGIALLWLIDLKLRKRSFNLRVGVLCFIAIVAFTPQTISESDSLAPLIITSLLNAETEGVSAIYKSLVTLLSTWGIVFFLILAGKHFLDAKKQKEKTNSNQQQAQ